MRLLSWVRSLIFRSQEDAHALKKVPKVEKDDITQFVEEIKGKKSDAGADEPVKKKQKSKKK